MSERLTQARDSQSWMVEHRRKLHQQPEVGLALPDTAAYVADVLIGLGLTPEVHEGAGISVKLDGFRPSGVTRVLRADMDALPVEEATGLPWTSKRPGAMHACGHDLHMAMILGAARGFCENPPADDVVLVFQPGEETDRGAVPTLAAHRNLPDGPATCFAIHVHATWTANSVHHIDGTFMAYGDWFRADFSGAGGHASQPHLAGNPIEASARFVLGSLELMETLGEKEYVVATTTESLAGNTVNVIPATGSLRGTLRTLSEAQRSALIHGLETITRDAGTATRTSAEFTLNQGYPAVVNDADYVQQMLASLRQTPLSDSLVEMDRPSMVIEDFAYFLQRWPGAMVYLGAQVEGHHAFNHAHDAVFDESVLSTGAALLMMAGDGWSTVGPG